MKNNNSPKEDFIQRLSGELQPIKVNWPAEKRAFTWVSFNTIATFLIMWSIGEFSFFEHLRSWRIVELILGLSTISILSYFTFLGMVPGASTKKKVLSSLSPFLAMIALFLIMHFSGFVHDVPGSPRKYCEVEILLLSLIPAIQMGYLIVKDKINTIRLSLLTAGLVSSFIPAFYMNYICKFTAMHAIGYHLLPVIAFSLLFALIINFIPSKRS